MPVRCAIYTRKSADEAADTQFGSIEAQRELCEAYAASQAGQGWQLLPTRYDDIGFSGGNLHRPALTRLLADVAAGELDIIVVYKIDRLSRSLRDFLNLVALLEQREVTFVAITQSFSTTSSMGRLTLNILLSFAQFERELTGDRLRDWFAGARARGLWTSGRPPLGYKAVKLRLVIDDEQAAIVRHMFRRYPTLGSSRELAKELNTAGHLNKFGRPFDKVHVNRILQSRVYRGEIPHNGGSLAGCHEPIVSEAMFRRVQREIAASARRRAARQRQPVLGMLKGLLFDAAGDRLIHVFLHRGERTYRYYVRASRYGPGTSKEGRYRAADLELVAIEVLDRLTGGPPPDLDEFAISGRLRRLVSRIDVEPDRMRLTLVTGAEIATTHKASCARPRSTAQARLSRPGAALKPR